MTKNNEQIIIDVNNCLYHDNGKCRNSKIGQCNCANVASCYYKECKRTEQEYKFWLHQAKLGLETTDRLAKELEEKEQECEKAKQNAQDTYDLWQALIESFNILQDEKIKLEQECERLKKEKAEILEKTGMIETLQGYTVKDIEYMEQQLDQLKEENDTLFKAIEKVNKINKRLESEKDELKKELESTKGLATVGNRQLAEALLELQKYKDREQWEIELNKKRADSFKEMRRMLYGKVEGSSLIEKRSPYEQF